MHDHTSAAIAALSLTMSQSTSIPASTALLWCCSDRSIACHNFREVQCKGNFCNFTTAQTLPEIIEMYTEREEKEREREAKEGNTARDAPQ